MTRPTWQPPYEHWARAYEEMRDMTPQQRFDYLYGTHPACKESTFVELHRPRALKATYRIKL